MYDGVGILFFYCSVFCSVLTPGYGAWNFYSQNAELWVSDFQDDDGAEAFGLNKLTWVFVFDVCMQIN